ncbi:MAG: methyltransferase domain-containing protein [Helicobacteraceae bacterium]|nr:methyltransferase domain-containing protein [Helicobacteraceae bacterium]
MGIVEKIKNIDNKLIQEYVKLTNKSDLIIPKDKYNSFVRVSGASESFYALNNKIINKSDESQLKCLVIGLHGGRDFWGLVTQGYDVWGMDLMDYKDIDNMKIGNAEEIWPYQDNEFDIIVMGEILEHLTCDIPALKEANRVLKDDGKLIVTVPYYDSNDSYHIRMYNEETLVHSFKIAGFDILDKTERPGLPFKSFFNYINAFLAIIIKLIFNKNIYFNIVPFYGELDYYLSKKNMFRKLFKFLKLNNYGGCVVGKKNNTTYDYIKVNETIFGR